MNLKPGATTYLAGVPFAFERTLTPDERDRLKGLHKYHQGLFWLFTNVVGWLAIANLGSTIPLIAGLIVTAPILIQCAILMRRTGRALQDNAALVFHGKIIYLQDHDHFQKKLQRDYILQILPDQPTELVCTKAGHLLLSANKEPAIGMSLQQGYRRGMRMRPMEMAWNPTFEEPAARAMTPEEKKELRSAIKHINCSGLTPVSNWFAGPEFRLKLSRDLKEGMLYYDKATGNRYLRRSKVLWSRNSQPATWRLSWPMLPTVVTTPVLPQATYNPTIDYL